GPRYVYVSSAHCGGASPGSPVHVSTTIFQKYIVRLTEGELKADVATTLSQTLTISVPGVASWKSALPILRELQPQKVNIAFDADACPNPVVARSLQQCYRDLVEAGFAVGLEVWDPAGGKGIDDLLAAGKQPITLAGKDADEHLKKIT